jgi:hypothetical protein
MLFLAFPAPPTLALPKGEDGDNTLGQGITGVRFFLHAEMCQGLRWQYSLLTAGCNTRNLPVKVCPAPALL